MDLVIDKDVMDISRVRQREMPPRLLARFAARSGQVLNMAAVGGAIVSGEDPRGLRLLKDRLGPRLLEAIVLYTGEYAYQHDGWIWSLPLSELWR